MDKYVKILKENEVKVTPQRLEIMRYLDENRIHPSADRIYSELKRNNPSLSKTTVYNTLETLKRYDIIQVLTITGGELRYDFETKMHHHFLCRKCNAIIDIDIECPYLEKTLKGEHRIDEVHGYFKGVCKTCLDQSKINR